MISIFEIFEGTAVRTDGKMGSSISTYEFWGHFGGGGMGWLRDKVEDGRPNTNKFCPSAG